METIAPGARSGVEDKEVQTAIREMFAKMDLIDERIAKRQAEIDRLDADTWRMLDKLKGR